ncbi:hypothetical protein CONCODRAFT_8936 [Conidiobolus coronatus NRRL 28638]|uniref:Uncharacterized protein n=1 Tax=Conidiobolus coronatus (strain ATCC 28846 / CBS 209.66 / NRRL 28638) TaxID=796925 RepID=A0A137P105_CONC2|nr:hypothetical protein CONCODRAFT_8936 [Conidiobolus coronatus NRRL 28638]|eukprot:KXN68727.1 hypothetical protein CONCODRAFT_8936 [Conidiobolus coronatus NRRL 28638]
MTYSKTFNIDYKVNPEELYYSIKGIKQNYEFDARTKDEAKLISDNGANIILATRKSKINHDLKLEFKMDPNFHGVEFVQTNDTSGFKVKGRYEAVPIDWVWKGNPENRSYVLIDNARGGSTIAEVKGLTLRKRPEVQLTIQKVENEKLEDAIIGTACLVFYTHNITRYGTNGINASTAHVGCIIS